MLIKLPCLPTKGGPPGMRKIRCGPFGMLRALLSTKSRGRPADAGSTQGALLSARRCHLPKRRARAAYTRCFPGIRHSAAEYLGRLYTNRLRPTGPRSEAASACSFESITLWRRARSRRAAGSENRCRDDGPPSRIRRATAWAGRAGENPHSA